jgi:chromosome segregation ATPase
LELEEKLKQIDYLKSQIRRLEQIEKDYSLSLKEKEGLLKELKAKSKQIEEYNKLEEKWQQETHQLQETLKKETAKGMHYQNDNVALEKKCLDVRIQAEALVEAHEKLMSECSHLRSQLSTNENEFQALQTNHKSSLLKAEREKANLLAEITQLRHERDSVRIEVDCAAQEIATAHKKTEEFRSKLVEAQKNESLVLQLTQENAELKSKSTNLENSLVEANNVGKEYESFKEEYYKLRERFITLSGEKNNLIELNNELKNDIDERENKFETEKKRLQDASNSTIKELKEREHDIFLLRSEISEVKSKLTGEAVLKNQVRLLDEKVLDHERTIQVLEQKSRECSIETGKVDVENKELQSQLQKSTLDNQQLIDKCNELSNALLEQNCEVEKMHIKINELQKSISTMSVDLSQTSRNYSELQEVHGKTLQLLDHKTKESETCAALATQLQDSQQVYQISQQKFEKLTVAHMQLKIEFQELAEVKDAHRLAKNKLALCEERIRTLEIEQREFQLAIRKSDSKLCEADDLKKLYGELDAKFSSLSDENCKLKTIIDEQARLLNDAQQKQHTSQASFEREHQQLLGQLRSLTLKLEMESKETMAKEEQLIHMASELSSLRNELQNEKSNLQRSGKEQIEQLRIIDELRREMEAVRRTSQEKESQFLELMAQRKAIEARSHGLIDEVKRLQDGHNQEIESSKTLAKLNSELNLQVQQLHNQLGHLHQNFESQFEAKSKALEESEAHAASLEKRVSELTEEVDELLDDLQHYEDEVTQMYTCVHHYRGVITEALLSREELQNKTSAQEFELKFYRSQLKSNETNRIKNLKTLVERDELEALYETIGDLLSFTYGLECQIYDQTKCNLDERIFLMILDSLLVRESKDRYALEEACFVNETDNVNGSVLSESFSSLGIESQSKSSLSASLNVNLITSLVNLLFQTEDHRHQNQEIEIWKQISESDQIKELNRINQELKERNALLESDLHELQQVFDELEMEKNVFEEYCSMQDDLRMQNSHLSSEVKSLAATNASLLGHRNQNQRIHYVARVKEENMKLKEKILHVSRARDNARSRIAELESELELYRSYQSLTNKKRVKMESTSITYIPASNSIVREGSPAT